ncbi:hypothetical protein PsorP6_003773 [Peronosclerospora sorghi]|uniref:Uncharacterized protein n=1 Tax=Peronosclerospora sorghi TaxID=230839 RepID=A0ACC0VLD6_9STRA|nr:hypothetical protein PsorP6_003773 [Peronosclerospora sorghi]
MLSFIFTKSIISTLCVSKFVIFGVINVPEVPKSSSIPSADAASDEELVAVADAFFVPNDAWKRRISSSTFSSTFTTLSSTSLPDRSSSSSLSRKPIPINPESDRLVERDVGPDVVSFF